MQETSESSAPQAQAGPPVPTVFQPFPRSAILVRRNQSGNPVLTHFHNVPWQFGDITADYQVGLTTGVLFLSLKYHRLRPEYIHGRIEELRNKYTLRVLLILCDVGDQHEAPIRELTTVCLVNELTIIVAWSNEEVAIYLQTYKAYENKSPDSIKERVDKDYPSLLRAALTSIKGVNKTDVTTLRTHFGSFANIAKATPDELSNCPGIGGIKVRRLNEAFNEPFRKPRVSGSTKGKEKASSSNFKTPATTTKTSSVVMPSPKTMAPPSGPSRPRRSPSPPWDIDLDLNPDDDQAPAVAR
ncbi:hypothetical protein BS47DRAFT_1370196 [Hydnum rufescens UP504]|uniref:DNA excision repair protein ERCC-1 n=1 Tax=Hydnum rufescens UP504 TaxID=1448309 RepID=A0A9P6BBJ3_9AGAM|nr:hypothetical protein BS47DRAFT_1370196 [Hydnum rufescens UP504]